MVGRMPGSFAQGGIGIMKTYTINDPELGLVSYVDRKRHLWLLSVLFPPITPRPTC